MEDKEAENTQSGEQKFKKIPSNEDRIRSLWGNFKRSNICIIGVPGGEEKEQEIENLFEKIMKENFLNLVKEIDMQVHKAQSPKQDGRKQTTPRHTIIKMPKVKDKGRILKAAGENKLVTYKGIPIRLSADFSTEALQARRDWQEIFRVVKSKDLKPRLFYPEKLSFRMEGQIKCFPDEVKLKEFIITKP